MDFIMLTEGIIMAFPNNVLSAAEDLRPVI